MTAARPGRIAAGVAALLLVLAFAPVLGAAAWPIDLAANLSAQVLGPTLLAAGWFAIRRRWLALALTAAAIALHAAALVGDRAPAGTADEPVRLLLFNAGPGNPSAAAIQEGILVGEADLVALTEPPPELVRGMPGSPDIARVYPAVAVRTIDPPEHIPWGILLSRWPIRPIEAAGGPGLFAYEIQRPGGSFAMIMIHPASPRTARRWRQGGDLVERAASLAADLRARGLPVVIAADLNSTPTASRSRRLATVGLRRAKPLLVPAGTFPRDWPWPASLAIDDAFVSDGIGIVSWAAGGALEPLGDDHMPVLIELSVPSRSSGGAGSGG